MINYTLTHALIADGLPALSVARADLAADAPLAFVLHGLGSHKERMLTGLYDLARAGLRAVALDLRLHGERPGADTREGRLQTDFFGMTTEIILGTTADITQAIDYYAAKFAPAKAGIHGISLGGYVTFAALLAEPRLQAAAVALGSPDWLAPLRAYGLGPGHPAYDIASAQSPLEVAAGAYPPRPLLMLHGTEDTTVSVQGVRALEERLRPAYAACPERLSLVLYPELGHSYTDEMQARSVAWLAEYLGA